MHMVLVFHHIHHQLGAFSARQRVQWFSEWRAVLGARMQMYCVCWRMYGKHQCCTRLGNTKPMLYGERRANNTARKHSAQGTPRCMQADSPDFALSNVLDVAQQPPAVMHFGDDRDVVAATDVSERAVHKSRSQ